MELIRKIVYLSYQIYNVYLELYTLEIENKKDNLEYFSLISNLKQMIFEEKRLYQCLGNNQNDYLKLLDFASDLFGEEVFMRIYGYMLLNNHLILKNGCGIGEEVVLQKDEFNIYNEMNKNIFLMQFSFIQEYIESLAFTSVKNKLIYLKYYNSFIDPYAGSYLVDYNFDVQKTPFVDFNFMLRILNIDFKNSSNVMLEGCLDAIKMSLNKLFRYNDVYYCVLSDDINIDCKVNNIIFQCMFRTGICLLDDRQYEMVRDSILLTINLLSNEFNTISSSIINSILDGRSRDRSRVRTISIGPINN